MTDRLDWIPKDKLIPFTQYLMPDGRKTQEHFPAPDQETYEKAQKILAAGLVFECEMLSDYVTVSFTITGMNYVEGEEMDLAHKICRNSPVVVETIKALIMEFDLEKYNADKLAQAS